MKQEEIRKKCGYCHKGIMHMNDPIFFRIKIDRLMVDMNVVHQQAGLEQYLGSPALAAVMGPDKDVAIEMSSSGGLVCSDCALRIPLMEIAHHLIKGEEDGDK